MDGLKFDLRIYVLLVGINPLRIYVYKEGIVWFATETYEKPNNRNLDNLFIHLTNYAINKKNKGVFNQNDEEGEDSDESGPCHKWPLATLWSRLEELNIDSDEVWKDIKAIIVKSIIAVQPKLI